MAISLRVERTGRHSLTVLQHQGFRSRGHEGGGGRWRVAVRISACLLDQMKRNDVQTDAIDIIRRSMRYVLFIEGS